MEDVWMELHRSRKKSDNLLTKPPTQHTVPIIDTNISFNTSSLLVYFDVKKATMPWYLVTSSLSCFIYNLTSGNDHSLKIFIL